MTLRFQILPLLHAEFSLAAKDPKRPIVRPGNRSANRRGVSVDPKSKKLAGGRRESDRDADSADDDDDSETPMQSIDATVVGEFINIEPSDPLASIDSSQQQGNGERGTGQQVGKSSSRSDPAASTQKADSHLDANTIEGPVDSDQGSSSVDDFSNPRATLDQPGDSTNESASQADLPPPLRRDVRLKNRKIGGKDLPSHVGKFAIKGELGRGAFGVVYLGYDEELQRNVAIKVSLDSNPKRQEKLRVEASKAAQIDSQGIVPVYHIGTTDEGAVYIVQKFIKGCSLRDVVKEKPLSPARATALIRELALALAPAHQMDILHRDLKPDNVLIDKQGKVWIADFGLAISESEQSGKRRELAGTPPYMSPEQISGRVDFLDPRSDLWALGVMYYELLTGKLPFKGKSPSAIREQICERDPRPLQQYGPGLLTEGVNEVFLKACAKKPSDRYATTIEFAAALDDLLLGGLSNQNINGDVSEGWFGENTLDFGTVSRSQSTSQFRSASGSMQRSGSVSGSKSESMHSNESVVFPASQSMMGTAASLLQKLLGLVAVIGLSLAASIVYQRYTTASVEVAESASGDPASDLEGVPDTSDVDGPKDVPDDTAVLNSDTSDNESGPADSGAMVEDAGDASSMEVESKSEPVQLPAGTPEDPFVVAADGTGSHTSISDAINDAGDNYFIKLVSGIYDESLLIDRSLTLMGVNKTETDGKYSCVVSNSDQSPFVVNAPDCVVRLQDLKILGKGTKLTEEFNAIELNAGTLEIDQCELSTSSYNSIKVRKGSSIFATGCRFIEANKFAVSTVSPESAIFRECGFSSNGIEFLGTGGEATGCHFYRNGIRIQDTEQKVSIADCTFEDAIVDGIFAINGLDIEIADSKIENCKNGIVARNCGSLEVTNTNIAKCESGISSINNQMRLTGGELVDIRKDAIQISQGSVAIDGTRFNGIARYALIAIEAPQVNLQDLDISDVQDTAIQLQSGRLQITNTTIDRCDVYGISLGDSGDENGTQKSVSMNAEFSGVSLFNCARAAVMMKQGDLRLENTKMASSQIGIYATSDVDESPSIVSITGSLEMGDGITKDIGMLGEGTGLSIPVAVWNELALRGKTTVRGFEVELIEE